MTLTVHHLNKSQSERIIWLCEELNIPYELILHQRNPETALAPESLKKVHAAGTAPVVIDDPSPTTGGRVALAESGAIVEYITAVHGGGKLTRTPADKTYPAYLEWVHFANGSLQSIIGRRMSIARMGMDDHPFAAFVAKKWDTACGMLEAALAESGAYLAGDELSAADIMTVFTLTTMRGFRPVDLGPYPAILAYLKRVGARPGYQRAMEKGDPGLEPMLGATVERFVFGKK